MGWGQGFVLGGPLHHVALSAADFFRYLRFFNGQKVISRALDRNLWIVGEGAEVQGENRTELSSSSSLCRNMLYLTSSGRDRVNSKVGRRELFIPEIFHASRVGDQDTFVTNTCQWQIYSFIISLLVLAIPFFYRLWTLLKLISTAFEIAVAYHFVMYRLPPRPAVVAAATDEFV